MPLSITRHVGEAILIGEDVEIVVIETNSKIVRLEVRAPRDVRVMRKELVDGSREGQR